MYRRIEFIQLFEGIEDSKDPEMRKDEWCKSGLNGCFAINNGSEEDLRIFNKMIDCMCDLKGIGTGKNNRYYFTELGWKEIGRKIIEYALKLKFDYRIICIKENSVDVMATDNKYEVAVRPRKRRN